MSGSREALVVLGSAIVLIASLGSRRIEPAGHTPPASDGAPEATGPSPLPSGAPRTTAVAPPAKAQGHDGGCSFADRGFGDYGAWRALPFGADATTPAAFAEPQRRVRVLVAPERAMRPDGSFDLLVHFHGAEPVRKLLAPIGFDLVIAALDVGTTSGPYERAFADEQAFPSLVEAVEREVAATAGQRRARARHLAISAWSAGYGAVSRLLARPHDRVDAVVLLDALYASFSPGAREPDRAALEPFVAAARAAQLGGPVFHLTYTQVPTRGYASTSEVAAFLARELDRSIALVPTRDATGDGPTAVAALDEGRLSIRGYSGAGREAHCEQLRLLPRILAEHVLPAFAR